MSNVMAMQRKQDRIGSAIPGLLSTAGSVVGGIFGGPAGAAAGGKVGGMVGGAVAEPNKQPEQIQTQEATPAPAAAMGQSSPGSSGAMGRRMETASADISAAENALQYLPPEQQKQYGQTLANARRLERIQGGY